MNARRLLALICFSGYAAAGCGRGEPTGASPRTGEHAAPHMDGGVMHGSGNRSDSTGTGTQASGTAGTAESGVLHGSGN